MKSNHRDIENGHVRVELKYCEHCGGLWVREGGAGAYCEKCASKVADLPVPKKRGRQATLPVRRQTVVEDCAFEIPEGSDLEAAGGVA